MPPKRRLKPLYKNARDYYKAAYRARIKAARTWNTSQITSTLAWMWLHASEDEKNISIDLHSSNAQTLPDTDDANIPDTPKRKDDSAPEEREEDPAPEEHQDAPEVEQDGAGEEVEEGPGGDKEHGGEPPKKKARVNTTAFPFWPDPSTINDIIPEESVDLLYPGGEEDETRWRGAHFLGGGATGRVALWVRLDEEMVVDRNLAVRDVLVEPSHWVSPIYWRDQLPRELAMQRRLHSKNGHDHHIHRYFADRISFYQRRYRVYNEVCDLGDLMATLDWYSIQWRRRSNLWHWVMMHQGIRNAREQQEHGAYQVAEQQAWELYTSDPRYRERRAAESRANGVIDIHLDNDGPSHIDPQYELWENMSDIENWHHMHIPTEGLPEVIPESFLWTVFDQLVDAFIILGTGGAKKGKGKKWQEIVHYNVTLANIFAKKTKGAEGVVEPNFYNGGKTRVIRFENEKASEFPSIVLADFDKCFFDLQAEGDIYADNPTQYVVRECPTELPQQGGRYPPEFFWNYAGYMTGDLERMTAKTDVWGVGQVMWNLIRNLPGKNGADQQVTLDVHTEDLCGKPIVNGEPYDDAYLEYLLTGAEPYEAARRYSKTLKNTVRECLSYRQSSRPSFKQLKKITARYAYGKKIPEDSSADGPLIVQISEEIDKWDVGTPITLAGGEAGNEES